MSKSPDLVSATPASPTHSLKPALKAALGSLDVQLEEELTRYRRQRRREQTPTSNRGIGQNQSRDPLDLIYVTATGGRTQPNAGSLAEMPPPSVSIDPPAPTWQKEELSLPQISIPPSAAELAGSNALEASQTANGEPSPTTEIAAGESLAHPNKSEAPNGYLESSEELLKSLGDPRATKARQRERNTADNLLSPLGIGSMLLFLMASAIFGYVATNPSGLKHLSPSRLFNQQTPNTAQNSNNTTVTTGGAAEASLPTSPNLASEEFVELDLGTLSTVNPSPTPLLAPVLQSSVPPQAASATPIPQVTVKSGPVPTPSPAAKSRGLGSLTAALLPPSNKPQGSNKPPAKGQPLAPPAAPKAPAPTVTVVTPSPAVTITTAPAATPTATPTAAATANAESATDDYFYVVLNYDGEASLEKARQVVADAYARDFPAGSQIQLGAFNDAATAQILVQELQRQGLAAKVYRP
ncbi:SPOR domain-containing protein [Microcoleus sp. FACHB-672]|uniref:SPOR domain-containing protein n=1 Tax=Microcoleus sp. FACHB-672 TaxID=2692825 RepID=UPI001688093E|nr:SPOR domain-containing protein [Microcoleus sp. FACHB-672]MBD2040697.1 hypothetical protein [Microcoleus sp. FACHB-672]